MSSDQQTASRPFALACSIVPYNFARWTPSAAIRSMASIGFEGVEMHAPRVWGSGRAHRLRSELDAVGLRPHKYLTGGHGIDVVPPSMAVAGEERRRSLEDYRRECDVAREAGFAHMVVFAGMYSADPAQHTEEFSQASSTMGRVCRIAAESGIRVLLETHAGSIGHDADSFLAIRDAAETDNLSANVDPSNYAAVRTDVVSAIHKLGPLVGGVHIKDMVAGTEEDPKWAPPGEGVVDWRAVLDALVSIDYRGPLAVEYEAGITGEFPVDAEYGSRRCADYIRQLVEGDERDDD